MREVLSPLVADGQGDVDDVRSDGADAYADDDEPDDHDRAEELGSLLYWLRIDRFDRRATNRQLAQLETALVRAAARLRVQVVIELDEDQACSDPQSAVVHEVATIRTR